MQATEGDEGVSTGPATGPATGPISGPTSGSTSGSTSGPAKRPELSAIKRITLLGLGWLFLGLALAGIPLPLLPTTPFLMLASACFMRSSPRLHERMLRDPRFGPLLAQWRRERSIPRGAKRKAYFVIVITFGISIVMIESPLLRGALVATGLGLVVFLARLRTGD